MERAARQDIVARREDVAGPGAAVVDRAEDPEGLATDVLDDVDLAARRPDAVDRVRGEHPKRRPQALADRHLGTHFHATVGPVTFAE